MPTANPDDVRDVMSTDLSDARVSAYLDDAEFDARDAIDEYDEELDANHRRQLEKYLAALYIVETEDRRAKQVSGDETAITYDGSPVKRLKSQVQKRDPSDTLASNTKQDSRNVTST